VLSRLGCRHHIRDVCGERFSADSGEFRDCVDESAVFIQKLNSCDWERQRTKMKSKKSSLAAVQAAATEGRDPYAPVLKRLSLLTEAGNTGSTYFGKNIPREKRLSAVAAHGFPGQDVFFLFDDTFWGGAETGVIMGRSGISLKYQDEAAPCLFAWKEVDDIWMEQIEGEDFLVILSGGWIWEARVGTIDRRAWPDLNECLNSLADIEQSDFEQAYEEISAAAETLPAEAAAATDDDRKTATEWMGVLDKFMADSGFDPGQPIKCLLTNSVEVCDGRLNAYPFYSGVLLLIRAKVTAFSNEAERRRQVDEISEALRECIESGETKGSLAACVSCSISHLARSMAEQAPQPDAREAALRLLREHGSDEDRELTNRMMASTDESRRDAYLQLSKQHRRTVLCTTKLPSWPTDEVRPIAPCLLENIGWTFPLGHPQLEAVYVIHPLRDDVYVPIEDFHHRIFQERFRELQRLLSALGASEIQIHSGEGLASEMFYSEVGSVGGKDGLITGGSLDGELDTEHKKISKSSRSVSFSLKLAPNTVTGVPTDLQWFKHEPTWQAIADEVMQGRVREYSIEFKYSDDYAVNQRLAVRLNAELRLFGGKVKTSISTDSDSFLRELRQSNTRIDVRFAEIPMTPAEPAQHAQVVQPPSAGGEYMRDILDLLVDGAISESARRLLKRNQARLGLSDDTAIQIEARAMHIYALGNSEQEFAFSVADCLDGGTVSAGARRLLQRTQTRLGIPEQRAAEIESLVCVFNHNMN
jgi:hypothetical protein